LDQRPGKTFQQRVFGSVHVGITLHVTKRLQKV
jgi:hypothetical protein